MKALAPFDVWIRTSWCDQEVAGEYYHAKAWRPFFPRTLPAAGVELTEQASLIREPNNRHDRNAVRVEVRGQHVGHLPAEDAARYRATLDHLAARGFVVRTHTRLWAGPEIEYQFDHRGELREVDTGKVNCRITLALPEPHLLIPLNPPPAGPHAMLPMGGSVMVKTDGVPMTVFESVLTDAGIAQICVGQCPLRSSPRPGLRGRFVRLVPWSEVVVGVSASRWRARSGTAAEQQGRPSRGRQSRTSTCDRWVGAGTCLDLSCPRVDPVAY